MAYYRDGTLTELGIMIGWLDNIHSFRTEAVDSHFLRKLLKLYGHRANQTRGFHVCPFCPRFEIGIPLELDDRQIKLGSAEIHVKASDGRVFAAPDLIYHYIVAHGYGPPGEFIQAVLRA